MKRDQVLVENVTGNQTSRGVRQGFPGEVTCDLKDTGLSSHRAECLASAGRLAYLNSRLS